jgi:hypothetical protein
MRVLPLALLLGCTAPTINVAATGDTRALVVETWGMHSLRPFVEPNHAARLEAIVDEINASTADVLCITGAPVASDAEALRARAAKTFPYSVWAKVDGNTPLDDPRTVDGRAAMLPTTPPCTEAQSAGFDAGIACYKEQCAAVDGTWRQPCACDATMDTTGPLQGRCLGCFFASVWSRSLDAAKKPCFTDPRGDIVGDGGQPNLLLSKRPIKEAKVHVLAAMYERPGLITARVDGIGIACFDGFEGVGVKDNSPYLPTGWPDTPPTALDTINSLTTRRALEVVHTMPNPVIVLGHFGLAWRTTGTSPTGSSGAMFEAFASELTSLVTRENMPVCDYCSASTSEEPRAGQVIGGILVRGFRSLELLALERTHVKRTFVDAGVPRFPATFGIQASLLATH